jgi:hypothetical protein
MTGKSTKQRQTSPPYSKLQCVVGIAWSDVPAVILHEAQSPDLAAAWRDGFNFRCANDDEVWVDGEAQLLDEILNGETTDLFHARREQSSSE